MSSLTIGALTGNSFIFLQLRAPTVQWQIPGCCGHTVITRPSVRDPHPRGKSKLSFPLSPDDRLVGLGVPVCLCVRAQSVGSFLVPSILGVFKNT